MTLRNHAYRIKAPPSAGAKKRSQHKESSNRAILRPRPHIKLRDLTVRCPEYCGDPELTTPAIFERIAASAVTIFLFMLFVQFR